MQLKFIFSKQIQDIFFSLVIVLEKLSIEL